MSHYFRPPMGALSRYSQTLGKIRLSKASLGSHEERGFRDHIFRPPSFRSRPTEPILAADANGGCGARPWKNAFAEYGGPTSAVRLLQVCELIQALRPGSLAAAVRHQ